MPGEEVIPVSSDTDVVVARQRGRALAAMLGFSPIQQTLIATAISEIARNIVQHAQQGEILLSTVQRGRSRGIAVAARDQGPGIRDVELALQDGYSTGGGLGLGLSGAKRLMDELEIQSEVGKGTTVIMKKWVE